MMLNNFLSNELIHALGWTVIHSIWQASLLAVLLLLALMGMKKRSAAGRYLVGNVTLVLLFVTSLSTFAYYYTAVNVMTFEPVNFDLIVYDSPQETSILSSAIRQVNTYAHLIVGAWLFGGLLFFLRFLGGWAYLHWMKIKGIQQLDAKWILLLENLKERIQLKQTVQLAESSLAKVPMVLGYLKPMILFPIGAINALPVEQVEAILAHELAHIKRHDFLLNIIQSVFELLYYYHPAMWWISGQIRAERENCCDDIALSICQEPLTYAKALTNIQTMQLNAPHLALAFGRDKHQLLSRIERILNQSKNNSTIMEKITASILIVLVIFAVTFSASASYLEKRESANKNMEFLATESMQDTSITKKVSKQVIETEDEANGKKTKVRVEMENGSVTKLKLNGKDIPSTEFDQHADLIARIERPKQIIEKEEVENGKKSRVRIEAEDGNVVKLHLDGKEIPPSEYDQHKELLDKIKRELPPPPPAAPKGTPGPPPTPEAPGSSIEYHDKDRDLFAREREKHEQEREFHARERAKQERNQERNHELKRLEAELQHIAHRFEEEISLNRGDFSKDDIKELMKDLSEKTKLLRKTIELNQGLFADASGEMENLEHLFEDFDTNGFESLLEGFEDLEDDISLLFEEDFKRKDALRFESGKKSDNTLGKALKADGLIKKIGKYRFELTENSLKINGKKQPDAVHDKYKSLYEGLANTTIDANTRVKINVN